MSSHGTVVTESGMYLSVNRTVMEVMGFRDFQRVTDDQAFQCIRLNAAAFSADMATRRIAREDVPDTTELDRLIAGQ